MKGIVAVILIGGAGYFLYKKFNPGKPGQVKYLIQNNYSGGTPTTLLGFDDNFIEAWYKAAKDGHSTFMLNGKSYYTKGGSSVK